MVIGIHLEQHGRVPKILERSRYASALAPCPSLAAPFIIHLAGRQYFPRKGREIGVTKMTTEYVVPV